jgi:hypothetical protein
MKPVAWYDPSNGAVSTDKNSPLFTPLGQVWPLFSQRPWVGLTDEDWNRSKHNYDFQKGVDWAEARLEEKNCG